MGVVCSFQTEKENRKKEGKLRDARKPKKPVPDLDLKKQQDVDFYIVFDESIPGECGANIFAVDDSKDVLQSLGMLRLTEGQWDRLQQKVNEAFALRRSKK